MTTFSRISKQVNDNKIIDKSLAKCDVSTNSDPYTRDIQYKKKLKKFEQKNYCFVLYKKITIRILQEYDKCADRLYKYISQLWSVNVTVI